MIYKALKLFFLIYLLNISRAFSQVNAVGHEFNSWLKAMHLDNILQAGEPEKLQVTSLVLKPVGAYQDPETFAVTWNYIRSGFRHRGVNIDSVLLNKLADFTFLPLDSVSLAIETANPDIFSLKVYYHKRLKEDAAVVLARGPNKPVNFNFDAAMGRLRKYYIITHKNDDLNAVYGKLAFYFNHYHHLPTDRIKIDTIISDDKKELKLVIGYVYRQILTDYKYHEVIYLDFTLGHDEISYSVDGDYAAGGNKTPDPLKNAEAYREIMLDYPKNWIDYIDKLDDDLKTALNAK
jgi:hypothetical protein